MPSDNVDGFADSILHHVPGIIDSASSDIGLIADRLIPVCGGKSRSKRSDSSDEKQDKRTANKRSHRNFINDEKCEDRVSDISGKAACNGPIPAKTQKGGADSGPTRGKEAKKPKAPKRASGARFQMKVISLKLDGSRPSNRILLDGYDSDTRVE